MSESFIENLALAGLRSRPLNAGVGRLNQPADLLSVGENALTRFGLAIDT